VVQVSNGVAVVAKNTWAAFQGKNALQIVWDEGPNGNVSSEAILADAERRAKNNIDEHVAISRGNPNASQGTVLEATYWGPFLAHATMEPMNATADVHDDGCEVWAPTQVQTRSQEAAAKASGLPPRKCVVHTTFLGGGFGRRLYPDYVPEAVEVSRAVKAPVKVMWTREDDTTHDYYRPLHLSVMRGVVSGGELVSLSHQVVAKSITRRFYPKLFKNGIDPATVAEAADAPYSVPNFRVTYIDQEHPIPTGHWRAPGANFNAFPTESFIDELAHAVGKDPLEFRLSLLKSNPRATNLLHLIAEKSGWGQKQAGIAQGLALIFWGGSYAAMVANVSMDGMMPNVQRVVTAVDVGIPVTPDIIVQQAQSATIFGLSAALTGKITIKNGRTQQQNFDEYTVLRMAQAPRIDVYIMPSKEKPTGVGEICTPPIAPAVGNAVFVLTGKRVRQLPFSEALT
jgi:isoquinoline 1-oxidoreductase subunit beta